MFLRPERVRESAFGMTLLQMAESFSRRRRGIIERGPPDSGIYHIIYQYINL